MSSCSPAPPAPKNSQNLCNPLWRALASKPLNRLSSFKPFYKWEAMMNLHILSDPVSDFWKCPEKGFKKKLFTAFFSSEFCRQTRATIARHHTCGCSHTMKTTSNVVFISRKQLIAAVSAHVGAHTVMYCTVLYCTVLYCTVPNYVTTMDWNKNLCGSRY